MPYINNNQNRKSPSLLWLALKIAIFSSPEVAENTLNEANNMKDLTDTTTRLCEVYAHVTANNCSNDQENFSSNFHKLIYKNGRDPQDGFTLTGWGLLGLGGAALLIGIGIEVYRKYLKLILNSYDRLRRKQTEAGAKGYEILDENIAENDPSYAEVANQLSKIQTIHDITDKDIDSLTHLWRLTRFMLKVSLQKNQLLAKTDPNNQKAKDFFEECAWKVAIYRTNEARRQKLVHVMNRLLSKKIANGKYRLTSDPDIIELCDQKQFEQFTKIVQENSNAIKTITDISENDIENLPYLPFKKWQFKRQLTQARREPYTQESKEIFENLKNEVVSNKTKEALIKIDKMNSPLGLKIQEVKTKRITEEYINSLPTGFFTKWQLNRQLQANAHEEQLTVNIAKILLAAEQKEVAQQQNDHFRPNILVRGINALANSKVGQFFGHVWAWGTRQAFIFWLVWMPFVLAIGLAAANTPFITLTILTISLSVTLAFVALKVIKYVSDVYTNKIEVIDPETKDKNKQEKDETDAVRKSLIQRTFIKEAHAAFKEVTTKMGFNWQAMKQFHPLKTKAKSNAENYNLNTEDKIKKVFNSKIGQYLLGNQHKHRAEAAIATIRQIVSGFISIALLWWVATASVGAIFVIDALLKMAPTLPAVLGTGVGVFFGIKTAAQKHAERLAYQEKVFLILNAEYKHTGATKQEMLDKLELSIELLKDQIKLLNHQADPAIKALLNIERLLKLSIRNPDYFEKQRVNGRPFFTWCKKFIARIYHIIAGGQTATLVIRTLFLASGVLGFVLAALSGGTALAAFLIIAGAAAAVLGTLRVIQYQLERDRKHVEYILEHSDDAISNLKKQEKELIAAAVILGGKHPEPLPIETSTLCINQYLKQAAQGSEKISTANLQREPEQNDNNYQGNYSSVLNKGKKQNQNIEEPIIEEELQEHCHTVVNNLNNNQAQILVY